MNKRQWLSVWGGVVVLIFSGLLALRADEAAAPADAPELLPVEHADCLFFRDQPERFIDRSARSRLRLGRDSRLSATTEQVTRLLSFVAADGGDIPLTSTQQTGSIDSYIFGALQTNNITPASKTTDWEFIRRVTLDLTGRIPTPARVLAFVADTTPNKRANLVSELLASPQWVDKWTMFYGDLFQNTATKSSTGLLRFPQGRNAFYQWIRDSLTANKPYNQMATELIATAAPSSYDEGRINYLIGGVVTGGPVQDVTDQMTANTFDTFLGITHVNCLLCHNGRGHLDQVSLWGSQTTRYQAWQLSSFLSHTQAARTNVTVGTSTQYYWSLLDNTTGFTTDYKLNTTTGNRPARVAPSGCKSGQPCFYVAPQYLFNGTVPQPGETYRAALARNITGDFQFARAAVNYLWAYFFGQGLVDPPDTFDPLRLDPNNPPPAPWTLQPSNPALLNALAQHFIDSGYNLKSIMSEIANSNAYQLSSQYPGQWDASWQPYFARKYVRRLWAEEVHDAVVQSSGLLPSYTITGFTDLGFAKPSYAMQLPDVVNMPPGDIGNNFLDSFLRGNRDDQPRKQDGSILQALNLMNNPFVEARLQATGTAASPLIAGNLTLANSDLINTLYLNILSRFPTGDEMTKAQAAIATGNRTQAVQDLVWSLYNKVDFVFNY
ncbi:MAG: DUF1549 and DUF1553 domain-containing protein [Acidobacteriia bacterium]|nr:DUF1549 and DUF1553 domain-containing protein [Terriglobia bacterium]